MKYVDEYRSSEVIEKLVSQIKKITKNHWTIMEVCGGQTHSIIRHGIDQLIPSNIELLHGPGCPVCVTPSGVLDLAIKLASQENVILCSFGDMLRVPGSDSCDLSRVRASGARVKVVYSPLDSVEIAKNNPDKEVVFLAVGFETTAPANALAIKLAEEAKLKNFSMLVSHVMVPPALESIMKSENSRVNAFLAAGHVCTIMGDKEYLPIVNQFKIPIVITGFEPVDILEGIFMAVEHLEKGTYALINQYSRSVKSEGNIQAMNLLKDVFVVEDKEWRGIGVIPQSGMTLSDKYSFYDATKRFQMFEKNIEVKKSVCISGEIMIGHKKPYECPAFGKQCTPEIPLGATMVSSEGACAAYYKYRRVLNGLPDRV